MTNAFRLEQIGSCVRPAETWNPARDASDKEIRYIDLSSVDNEAKRIIGHQEIQGCDAPSRARQLVKANDILVSTVRPNLNGVARVPLRLEGATASTGFCVLRTDQTRLLPNYLFQWVKNPAFVNDMVRKATGASYPAVSDRIVLESRIPLPPLSDQKRIAAILDQADELCRIRQRAADRLSAFPQALFREMFPADRRFPEGRIDEICTLVTDGTHYTPTYAHDGVIFLSAKNVTSGYVDWKNVKYIPNTLHVELQKRVSPQIGDVLLAKNGTTGIAAVVDREVVFDIYVSLALLRPSDKIHSTYLLQAVNSPECRKQFHAALKGIGVPNLHLVDIRQARIPVPPLSLQSSFADRIKDVEILRSHQQQQLARLKALFCSLQHRAFRGELSSKDAERQLAIAS